MNSWGNGGDKEERYWQGEDIEESVVSGEAPFI